MLTPAHELTVVVAIAPARHFTGGQLDYPEAIGRQGQLLAPSIDPPRGAGSRKTSVSTAAGLSMAVDGRPLRRQWLHSLNPVSGNPGWFSHR